MLHNEKELVKELKCEELCVISEKDKKTKKLAEKEMDRNYCPPCYEE